VLTAASVAAAAAGVGCCDAGKSTILSGLVSEGGSAGAGGAAGLACGTTTTTS
jgi:hypothetical protein